MSRLKPRFVLINTVVQLKKYHSTDGIHSSYIALTIKYLRLHVKSACRVPKPIEDECVHLDNSRGGYYTATNWTTAIHETGILQLHIGPRTFARRVAKVLKPISTETLSVKPIYSWEMEPLSWNICPIYRSGAHSTKQLRKFLVLRFS